MKATIELPDELMREIKIRAAREDRKLKDLVADLLRQALRDDRPSQKQYRVQFPLIHTAHPAAPGQELTPDVIHQILLDQEVEWLVK